MYMTINESGGNNPSSQIHYFFIVKRTLTSRDDILNRIPFDYNCGILHQLLIDAVEYIYIF